MFAKIEDTRGGQQLRRVILGLVVLRAVLLLLGEGALGGDGLGYVASARQILDSGALPPPASQPLGFAVLLVPIIALLGEAGRIDYATKAYPGFPGFTDDPIASSVHLAQMVMDLIIVVVLIHEVRKLLAGYSDKIVTTACGFAALQPFTAAQSTFVLPDHTAMFAFFVGAYLASLFFFRSRQVGLRVGFLALGAFLLGVSGLARVDMLPVAGAVLGVLYLWQLWTQGFSRIAAMLLGLLCFAAPILGMAALQYRSTGDIIFADIGGRNTPTLTRRDGYYAWARTWIMIYHTDMARFAGGDQNQGKAWIGFDINQYPRRAFQNAAEREHYANILERWRQSGYTAEIDHELNQLALTRHRKAPLFCFFIVPAVRMVHFWINFDGSRPVQSALRLRPPLTHVATALVFPFRVLMVMLALVGVYSAWIQHRTGNLQWNDGYGFARLCTLMVVLRTGELGVLGVFLWAGVIEPRYAIVAMPAMVLLAIIGFGQVRALYDGERYWGRRAEQAQAMERSHHGSEQGVSHRTFDKRDERPRGGR